jgi:hypothetical protein
VNVRRNDSALTAGGAKLLKELFKFIGNAKALQCICFESLEIPKESLPLLGKSLVASASGTKHVLICLFGSSILHAIGIGFLSFSLLLFVIFLICCVVRSYSMVGIPRL